MQKRFVRNLALLLFLNLLIKPFWILGVDRAVQNAVGDANYGFYLSIYSFSFLFYILLDLGITNFNNRNIAQNNHLLNKHFAGITSLKMLLALLYGIVTFLIGVVIGYNTHQLILLAWVGFNQVLLSFILYLRSNISGLLLFKTDSFLSVLDRVLMIIICSFMLWSGLFHGTFQIEWFVYAQTAAYLATTLVAIFVVLRHAGQVKLTFSAPFSIMIIKRSLPYALLVLLMSFYNRLEPVLLERLLPKEISLTQTGIYGKAFRLLDAGNNISLLFAVLLLPIFSALIKRKESVQQLTQLSFSLIISMTGIVAVMSIFYSSHLMELLYGLQSDESLVNFQLRTAESAGVFRVLMGSFVAVSVTYIFGTLLTANGNLKMLNIIAASGVVLNVSVNLLLIPRMQALGAAYASLGVQVFTAILQFALAEKIFHLRFSTKFWFRLLTFFVFITSISWISTQFSMNWMLAFVISLSLNFLLVFAFKILNIKELRLLLIKRET